MRVCDARAVEALSAYLKRNGRAPEPYSLASVIGTATGADGCELTVGGAGYRWGHDSGGWLHHDIRYHGRVEGFLAVSPRVTGPLPAVAAALGPVLTVLRMATETERLRRDGDATAHKLIDDRWRAAVEMEQERRTLERDLHDGAQHQLVALRMSLALVEHTGATRDDLRTLLSKLDIAKRALVDTAGGMLPIVLAADGLAAALTTALADHDGVTLDLGGLHHRYRPVVESTVYFACLEAVNNTHKHAPGARITVTAWDGHGGLEFSVADTGPGFTAPVRGSGLNNLSERAAAVGGRVDVRSAPGRGTTVRGFVPS